MSLINPIYSFAISAGAASGPPKHYRRIVCSNLFRHFLSDECGATAIEYGLIAAGIAVVIIAVVNGLGTSLNTTFSSISSQLK